MWPFRMKTALTKAVCGFLGQKRVPSNVLVDFKVNPLASLVVRILSFVGLRYFHSRNMSTDPDRDLDKCYETILELVEKACDIIKQRNDTRQEFVHKAGDIDLVTETDKEVEQLLIRGLSAKFPSHKFIGEEESSAGGAPNKLTNDPTWIIDPIDGTMNFVHAFPHSCVSVGLVVDKVVEIGVIYNPLLPQRFTARRGQGTFFNECRVQVSGQKELSKALITTEFGTSRDAPKMVVVHENFVKIAAKAHGIRVMGAAALNMAMVAMGSADANYEFGVHAWDVCAGSLIVREAGGVVLDPSGGPFDMMSRRVLAAATPELAKEVAATLTMYQPLPRDD